MTFRPHPPALWTALSRTVRPTHGARCNAADGLSAVRSDRLDRAQAMAAFARPPVPAQDHRR